MMIYDAAGLFQDLMSGLSGLLSDRTTFDDPGRMTWVRWLWIMGFTAIFAAFFAVASALGPAISRLLGL